MDRNIIILTGGSSAEKDISLKSAAIIKNNLQNIYNIKTILCEVKNDKLIFQNTKQKSLNFKKYITQNKTEAVFIVIHGTPGEDGIISKYLEKIKIPYTSSNSFSSKITFNKYQCYDFLKDKINIMSPKSICVKNKLDLKLFKKHNIKFPCFVKPNNGGSSFGASISNNINELVISVKKAKKYDKEVLIETFITGIEVTCGTYSIDNKIYCLPITEIVSENDFFDYDAKYKGLAQEITPARINKNISNKIINISKKIYKTINLKGIVRIDYIIKNNTPYFIEVNTIPGMSKESIIPKQIKTANINIKTFLSNLVENCIKEH